MTVCAIVALIQRWARQGWEIHPCRSGWIPSHRRCGRRGWNSTTGADMVPAGAGTT